VSSVDVTWCCGTTVAVRMATSEVEAYTCNRHFCIGTQLGTVVYTHSGLTLSTYRERYLCVRIELGAFVYVYS